MYFLPDSDWIKSGYKDEKQIFFFQVWQELISKSTYISWHVKTSNTKSLIRDSGGQLNV